MVDTEIFNKTSFFSPYVFVAIWGSGHFGIQTGRAVPVSFWAVDNTLLTTQKRALRYFKMKQRNFGET